MQKAAHLSDRPRTLGIQALLQVAGKAKEVRLLRPQLRQPLQVCAVVQQRVVTDATGVIGPIHALAQLAALGMPQHGFGGGALTGNQPT
ncbi:hypothetical protein D3C79_863510 [compost metagenome]